LQDYLDGDVSGPDFDDTLNLGSTTWNATVADFEDASLALATGPDGYVRFSVIGENIPDFAITPTVGNETLVGTTGADTISGLAGSDNLVGRDGADILNGDSGSDMLLGGSGNDTLRGGLGNDILAGGIGADHFTYAETGFANSDNIVDYSYVGRRSTLALSNWPCCGPTGFDFVRGAPVQALQVDIDCSATASSTRRR
jgi:Ca2+-binding RTX toxin-like protein